MIGPYFPKGILFYPTLCFLHFNLLELCRQKVLKLDILRSKSDFLVKVEGLEQLVMSKSLLLNCERNSVVLWNILTLTEHFFMPQQIRCLCFHTRINIVTNVNLKCNKTRYDNIKMIAVKASGALKYNL